MNTVQYVSDEHGTPTAVIVPIQIWEEIISKRETAYLLTSETMKKRLLKARQRQNGINMETICEKLGI
ncbi:hypothetical protein QUF50_03770 [Thiotrichales bacterium HSG1]|nr:hypothetical protein [Thiotrichales bacterium HSG1]